MTTEKARHVAELTRALKSIYWQGGTEYGSQWLASELYDHGIRVQTTTDHATTAGDPRGLVEIGHAMIDCPRCGVPRHVPVGAVCRPVSTSRTATFRVKDGSDEVGRVYVELRFLSDGHRCGPPGKPAPTGPRPVRAV